MKANRVRVSYFDYITITELEIDQKIGEHAKARIRGTIRDKDIEEYKKLLTQKYGSQSLRRMNREKKRH